MRIYIHTCSYIYIYVCVCVYVCMYICMYCKTAVVGGRSVLFRRSGQHNLGLDRLHQPLPL